METSLQITKEIGSREENNEHYLWKTNKMKFHER